jgi:BASS family bile acid:Na+ symporter
MTAAHLVQLVIQLSIALTVVAFALSITREDVGYLISNPRKIGAAFLSMNVLVPLLAVLFALAFDLSPATKVALIALAVSPVSPLLPSTEVKGGGRKPYAIGLFAGSALLGVLLIPFTLDLVGRLFRHDVPISGSAIMRPVMLPLIVGAVVRAISPRLADRIARPMTRAGAISLLIALVPLLISQWHSFGEVIGGGTLIALLGFCGLSLLIGHELGGSERDERLVLALSSATRHPAIALSLASTAAPRVSQAGAAVLLYVVLSALAGHLYLRATKRRDTAAARRISRETPAAG